MTRKDEDTGKYKRPFFDDTETRPYKRPMICPSCEGEGRIEVVEESMGTYHIKGCLMCDGTGVFQ